MIRRIEALRYRGLRYILQEVRPFQILVGPNASGKSTFLDVPALFSDFVRDGVEKTILFGNNGHGRASRVEELFFNQEGNHLELALEFALPESVQSSPTVTRRYDCARYELHLGRAESGELTVLHEVFGLFDSRTDAPPGPLPTLFPQEVLPPNNLAGRGKELKKVASRSVDSGNFSFAGERKDWKYNFKTRPQNAVLAVIPDDMERFPAALWVRELLLNGIHTLALNGHAMRRPVSPSVSQAFQVDGSNLPQVVRGLKDKAPDQFRRWLAHLKTILKGLADVTVIERPEDRHLYLALRYDGLDQLVPSWLVSDGTLRVLALTLLAYIETEGRIYLIEEPENGVHPRALEGIYDSLSSIYGGQVLVATHSPLFLGLAKTSDLLCFAKTPEGVVDIVAGDLHPDLRTWQGSADLETLYAMGVLG